VKGSVGIKENTNIQ